MNSTTRYTLASFSLLFLLGAFVATPGAVLPAWRLEFGVQEAMAAFFNAQLLGLLLGVSLAIRLRRRHPLVPLAAVALGVGYAAMALAPAFGWVVLAAGVAGLAQGVLNVHANGLVGELHPERRVLMLNRVNAAFGLGAVSAPLLMTLLPWRAAFWGFALAFFASAVLVWGAPPTASASRRVSWSSLRAALPLLLAVGLYVGVEASISAWSGAYLTDLGYSVRLAGALLAGYWLLLTASRLGLARWVAADPMGRLYRLVLASLAVLVALVWPPLAPLFPLVAVFYGPIFGTSFAALQGRFGQELTAGMFYAAAVGGTIGPALFAALPGPRWIPLGFVVLGALLFLALRRAREV
ncbi:MFS transporter [Deinococcota bacterium DY0809b]